MREVEKMQRTQLHFVVKFVYYATAAILKEILVLKVVEEHSGGDEAEKIKVRMLYVTVWLPLLIKWSAV